SIEGEAVLAGEASTATLAGRVLLTAASRAQGLVTFDAALGPPPARDGGERVRGRVRIDGRDLAYPGRFAGGALGLAADLQASSDSVRLAVSDARAEAAPVAGVLPALARELENATVTVELKGEGDRPPTLQWRFADQSAELVGRLEARAGDARVATALRLETGADAEAELSGLTARNLPRGDLLLGADSFDGTIVLAPEEWRIEGAGTLLATGKIASVGFDAATVSWAGTVTGTPQRVVLSVEDCMEWRAAAVDVGGKRIAEPAPLCVAPADDGVLLSYELDEDRSDFAFSIGEQPLAFRLVTDDGPYAVEGLWPSLAVSGETNAAGIATLSARLSGGALSSPEAGVAVQVITGTAELRDGALTST